MGWDGKEEKRSREKVNLIDSCFVVLITYYNSFKETNLTRDRQGTGVLEEG